MKQIYFLTILCIGVILSSSIHAKVFPTRGKKVYLQAKQISLQDDGIIVNLPKGFFKVFHLKSDAKGYYVNSNELLRAKEMILCTICRKYYATDLEDLKWHKVIIHRVDFSKKVPYR